MDSPRGPVAVAVENPLAESIANPIGDPERPPRLVDIDLDGPRLYAHRILQAVTLVLTVVIGVTYFMDWHEVIELEETGIGMMGLACAFQPDCDPSFFDRPISRPVPTGNVERDTGFDHSGPVVLLLLWLIAAFAVISGNRSRWPVGMVLAALSLGVCFAMLVALFNLDHLFEKVRTLPAETVFSVALMALCLVVLVNLVAQPILYITARRAKQKALAGIGLASARVIR